MINAYGRCNHCVYKVKDLQYSEEAFLYCENCRTVYVYQRYKGYGVFIKDNKNSKRPDSVPAHLWPESISCTPDFLPAVKQKEALVDTYESCYWKYVNATDWDNAKYWFNQMQAKITMDLEPAKGGRSWVEEPKAVRISASDSYRNNKASYNVSLIIFIATIIGMIMVCV